MHAYLLDQPAHTLSGEDLAAEGILYWNLPTDEAGFADPLQRIRDDRGYVSMDQVHLDPNTPDLDALLTKFFAEHLHTDEEIRFVVGGSGIFDLRNREDRWMRVHVAAGDLIIVPAHKYHRFTLDDGRTITCKRLFQDTAGWAAVPRFAA
ncbi:MAG: cupin domain-containing protein [Deltaproteobacteria bacterium]|nr:cupin domain-containing protein [Deltaproteobacteria bacterium]